MWIHRYSLFSYLLVVISVCSSLILGLVIRWNRIMMSETLENSLDANYLSLVQSAADQIDLHLGNVEDAMKRNEFIFTYPQELERENAAVRLSETLKAFESIHAMEIIFPPEEKAKIAENGYKALYVWRDPETKEPKIRDRQDPEKDYETGWFTRPFTEKKPSWSIPYFDPDINVLMITYSMPILNEAGDVEVILTADVTLEWIYDLLNRLPLQKTGEPILVSAEKRVIYHSDQSWEIRKSFDELAQEDPNLANRRLFAYLAQTLDQNESGNLHFQTPLRKKDSWFFYSKIHKVNWWLSAFVPESEIFGNIRKVNHRIILFGVCGIILLIFPSYFIARSVAHPISQLCRSARELAAGNFENPLPAIQGNGEIPKLVGAFDTMRTDLKRYIHDIKESTQKEEHFRSQLAVAHSIQLGMVPKNFETARQNLVDLYAIMKPAQDVGGDLYDFAVLDSTHLYFCIGDVSGKGIPASIFMACGKTLIRSAIQIERDPAQALRYVNNELMNNNEGGLFITALCGVYHLDTNELEIACAGHDPPVLLRADGRLELIQNEKTLFPLAIIGDTPYESFRIPFNPGDTFFLYTDGVTDAINPENEFFGRQRLLKSLENTHTSEIEPLVQTMMKNIEIFVNGAKQSDDITILAFRHPNQNLNS